MKTHDDLIDRLRHCQENASDLYLTELCCHAENAILVMDSEIIMLRQMIDNGLEWEDMQNDAEQS